MSRPLNDPAPQIRTRIAIPIEGISNDQPIDSEFVSFTGLSDHHEHLAITFGQWATDSAPLVRIHSECLTGDVFGSLRCDCQKQLEESIETMRQSSGIILYLRQEGRGIGLYNKLDSYRLQSEGKNTYEANQALDFAHDLRDYRVAAEMLQALEKPRIQLMTNNPDKVQQLKHYGIEIERVIPTKTHQNAHNAGYLRTKAEKALHTLDLKS